LDRRLGGTQSRSGRGVEEKNSQPPPEVAATTNVSEGLTAVFFKIEEHFSEFRQEFLAG
jgi:hypothetical protein